MTDDLILNALVRLEAKLDDVRHELGSTRESMATLRARSAETHRRVDELTASGKQLAKRVTQLEGFRAWILGAIAVGGAFGGAVASVVVWALGG